MEKSKIKWFITSTGVAPIYCNPNFNSECLTETVYGESNRIIDHQRNWIQVECEDGYRGWVNKFYGSESYQKNNSKFIIAFPNKDGLYNPNYPFSSIVKEPLKGAILKGDQLGFDSIIYLANQLLGIPYKWGGRSSLGFDCSGLVQSILKVCGYDIPRDSYQQKEFFQDCEIKMFDTQSGDIHFFGKMGKVTHVAFSTGGYGIIHAQGNVKKESLCDKDKDFNKNLYEIYLSSVSIRLKFEA